MRLVEPSPLLLGPDALCGRLVVAVSCGEHHVLALSGTSVMRACVCLHCSCACVFVRLQRMVKSLPGVAMTAVSLELVRGSIPRRPCWSVRWLRTNVCALRAACHTRSLSTVLSPYGFGCFCYRVLNLRHFHSTILRVACRGRPCVYVRVQ